MSAQMKSVLVVDDEPSMRMALRANFLRDGWQVETAGGANEALRKFGERGFPLVVTDVRMPDGDGLHVMRTVRSKSPSTAVILLTAFGSVPEAVEAIQHGACDYLMKPISFEQLQSTITRVMQNTKSAAPERKSNHEIIGNSPALLRALNRARHAASTNADVLVEAESGTGKELLARYVHQMSDRRDKAFVAVNCAAVPEHLLESELFGHVRGAFTGATAAKPGKFELANGGTLLLDEIGEMSIDLQPKLLRVLQEREIERLGDTRTVRVDVRVIATTNVNLQDMVEEGRFRADLYYRLNVIPLTLPPLRDRVEDIPVLAEFFAEKYALQAGKDVPLLHPDFIDELKRQPWRGNIREFSNCIRRAIVLSSDDEIGPEHLEIGKRQSAPATPKIGVRSGSSLREVERRLLEETLQMTQGNRTRAAELLGVSLRTVRNRIREYQLPPRRFGVQV